MDRRKARQCKFRRLRIFSTEKDWVFYLRKHSRLMNRCGKRKSYRTPVWRGPHVLGVGSSHSNTEPVMASKQLEAAMSKPKSLPLHLYVTIVESLSEVEKALVFQKDSAATSSETFAGPPDIEPCSVTFPCGINCALLSTSACVALMPSKRIPHRKAMDALRRQLYR